MKIRDIELKKFGLKIVAGEEGLGREITTDELYRPELILTGFNAKFDERLIQIFGKDSINYLNSLNKEKVENVITLFAQVPCIIVTDATPPPDFLVELCAKKKVPLFTTSLVTSQFSVRFHNYLIENLHPGKLVHGTLVDVYGMGILLTGESGIGKTECALDLVTRGHRLVADDIIRVKRTDNNSLIGEGAEKSNNLKYHIEIRGIGILDIRQLFGIRGIRRRKSIEIEVKLVRWKGEPDYTRTGLEENKSDFLGIKIPLIVVPLVPGKNISSIIEAIALSHLLKIEGHYMAESFDSELIKVMHKKALKNHRENTEEGKTQVL